MSNRGSEPAYPVPEMMHPNGEPLAAEFQGMSTRLRIASEQMAGMQSSSKVMQGMLDYLRANGCSERDLARHVALIALESADALLAAEEETR